MKKNTTGPRLIGLFDRIPTEKWFEDYLKNEDSLLKSGNNYALEISNYSEITSIHHFTELDSLEIKELKNYILEK